MFFCHQRGILWVMKDKAAVWTVFLVALCVLGLYGLKQWGSRVKARSEAQALSQASQWGSLPHMAARQMIEEYGPPQLIFADRLVWTEQRPWKRISVLDSSSAPLEQAVSYAGPVSRLREPVRLPHGAVASAGQRELVARSNSEELNRLCLNLADDIAKGKRSRAEAWRFYLRTVELTVAGKSSPYMRRLLFEVPEPEIPRRPLAHF